MAGFNENDLILNRDGSVFHLNLKPGKISENIILVGDPGHVHRVSKFFDDVTYEMNQREFITHTGIYKKKKITVISTGMGTENLETALIEIDAIVNIDLKKRETKKEAKQLNLVRIGTSTSIQGDLKTGSQHVNLLAIGMGSLMDFYQLEQSDYEKSLCEKLQEALSTNFLPYCISCDDSLRQQITFDMVEGNVMTTPGFFVPQGRATRAPSRFSNLIDKILYFHFDDFWFTNLDMETAALYGMSRLLGHRAISINAIVSNSINNSILKEPNKTIDGIIMKVLERI